MGEQVSDAELIARSFADPEQFAPIFERHYQSIFRFLVRRLGRETGARLASEVFTRAFESRHRFLPDSVSARPWLFGIANNLVRMEARGYRRRRTAYLRLPADEAEDGRLQFDRVEERVDVASVSESLSKGLARLKPTDRETLLLYALGELTYQEVADAMGVPIGTVRSRLARVRVTLRELLEGMGQRNLWDDGT
jgi:RNA polymerase sigma-70 factor (ECF subfamily)